MDKILIYSSSLEWCIFLMKHLEDDDKIDKHSRICPSMVDKIPNFRDIRRCF